MKTTPKTKKRRCKFCRKEESVDLWISGKPLAICLKCIERAIGNLL